MNRFITHIQCLLPRPCGWSTGQEVFNRTRVIAVSPRRVFRWWRLLSCSFYDWNERWRGIRQYSRTSAKLSCSGKRPKKILSTFLYMGYPSEAKATSQTEMLAFASTWKATPWPLQTNRPRSASPICFLSHSHSFKFETKKEESWNRRETIKTKIPRTSKKIRGCQLGRVEVRI